MDPHRRAAFAEEAAEVEVLNANVDKIKSLTQKIEASMARVELHSRRLEELIAPVYGRTQELQTILKNCERSNAYIEKLREPLRVRDNEGPILRSKPDKVGLSEYMSSLDRTKLALESVQGSDMRVHREVRPELTELLSVGTQNLENSFRDTLRKDTEPIEPLKQITTGAEFPRLSSHRLGQLRTMNSLTSTHIPHHTQPGELTPSARVYAHERGQYITSSLQNLAAASISTARKINPEAVYKQGSNAIGSYAQGILGMYLAEYDNISSIFSLEESGSVLYTTCQSSLAAFASTLMDLDAHIRNYLVTDCYLAYEIIEVVSTTSFQLEPTIGELKQPLSEASKPIRETAKASLSDLLNDTRTKLQQTTALPVDGAAVPITADVMTRLQTMTAYLPPLSSIMRSLGDGGWAAPSAPGSTSSIPTLKSFDVGADGRELFSHYSLDTIETLLNSLESAARRVLRGRSLQGIFLANNISVVERMIRSSELEPLLSNAQPKLDSWKKKASLMYLEAWRDTGTFLLDVQYTSKQPRPPSTGQAVDSAAILKSLSSKDKDGIKEKFKNFNTAFDELVAKHKSYRMEGDVRRQAGHEVQTFVEPLYARFWDRYHDVEKGKGKYVKYDKIQLSSVLASLS